MAAATINLTQLSDRGVIRMWIGPMFAGKTSLAVYTATKMSHSNKVLFVNWRGDIRKTEGGEEGKFSSHSPSCIKLAERVDTRLVVKLEEISAAELSAYQVVVIDECQFYPDLVEMCKRWAFRDRKHLYVFGLDGDYLQRPIGQTLELIPLAISVEKMLGQCRPCLEELAQLGYAGGRDWCPSYCTSRAIPEVEEGSVYVVGADETYIPVCGFHAIQIQETPLRADREEEDNA